jgi:hypothetical protein
MVCKPMQALDKIRFALRHFTITSRKSDPIGITKNKNRVVERQRGFDGADCVLGNGPSVWGHVE